METDERVSIVFKELRKDSPDYDLISATMSDPEEIKRGDIWMDLNYLVIGYVISNEVTDLDIRTLIRFSQLASAICTNLTQALVIFYDRDKEKEQPKVNTSRVN